MSNNTTVTLTERKNKNGTSTLILDIYAGTNAYVSDSGEVKYRQNRSRKSTGLCVKTFPTTAKERREKKETLALAEEIRRQWEQELRAHVVIDKSDLSTQVDFYEFYEDYMQVYNKKDKKHIKRGIRYFKEYLGSIRRYKHFVQRIECKEITRTMIEGYTVYLQNRFTGEGPHTVYARFKKVIKRAFEEGLMPKNPCAGISIKCDTGQLKKDTLTQDEITKLIATHYAKENKEVRRAFIFSLFTGIRGCDVRELTFQNISFDDKTLKFYQRKTEGHSSTSLVQMPLSEPLLNLIGPMLCNKDTKIFNLPSDTTCNNHLNRWVKAAGIDKHITWHCARHSFGSNLCEEDVNPMTIMALMGHSSLKYTNVYVRVRDKAKKNAIEILSKNLTLC